MIYLLDSNEDYDRCAAEIGGKCGQLLTPLTRRKLRDVERFGIDNGAYARFDAKGFTSLLARHHHARERCVFVAAPDVICNARRTLEVFRYWQPILARDAWPVALVIQDGIQELDIPWHLLKAVFIGGSDDFKLGRDAVDVIRAAQAMGKWVHIGRINSPHRADKFTVLRADSCDGTGISRYTHMREAIKAPTLYSEMGVDHAQA